MSENVKTETKGSETPEVLGSLTNTRDEVARADRPSYPTIWEAVVYGRIGNQICRVTKWEPLFSNAHANRYTLHPIDGGTPHCALQDGDFTPYTEKENEIVRIMLANPQPVEEYEPVWKD